MCESRDINCLRDWDCFLRHTNSEAWQVEVEAVEPGFRKLVCTLLQQPLKGVPTHTSCWNICADFAASSPRTG